MNDLIKYLEKFHYKFVLRNDILTIYIDNSFVLTVEKEECNYKIVNCTKGWSILSGVFNGSLKKILIVNSILLIAFFLIMQYFTIIKNYDYEFTFVLLIAISLYYSWYFYYLIKIEFLQLKIEKILYGKEN